MKKHALGLIVGLLFGTAGAADFPTAPVRIVVPVAAGGGLDGLARMLAPLLSKRWGGQPVIIENRPGVAGITGASTVANARPDGYTLLVANDAIMVSNRYLYKSLPYNPDKDFEPVAMLVEANQMVLANPSVQANDLKELVALVQQNPGKYSYASYGVGSPPNLTIEALNKHENLDILDVAYKGVAPSMTAVLGGEVQLSVASGAVAGKLLEAGRMKALAVASPERDPKYPQVKTTAEMGYPDIQVSIWHSMYAPAGTPREIVEKIATDVREALKDPEFVQKVPHFRVLDGGPAELAKRIAVDAKRMQGMIAVAGVKPQ